MSISEQIKAINNKIDQNKGQYHQILRKLWICLRLLKKSLKENSLFCSKCRQTNYEFLTDKDVLPEKYVLENLLQ